MSSAWLEMTPRTSAEAGRQANHAKWAAWGALGFVFAMEAVVIALTGAWDGRMAIIGGIGSTLLAAIALVRRETYHRLKDAGR